MLQSTGILLPLVIKLEEDTHHMPSILVSEKQKSCHSIIDKPMTYDMSVIKMEMINAIEFICNCM